MEKFSYFLYRNGCTLYFAVLEQPEEWRRDYHKDLLYWDGREGEVCSEGYPEIKCIAVHLRGSRRDKDMMISRADFGNEQSAIEKEAQVHRLLTEFVQAGGFSGKRKPPEAPSVVTAYTI